MHVPRQLKVLPQPRQTLAIWAKPAKGRAGPSQVKRSNEVVVTTSGAKGPRARTNTSSMGVGETLRTLYNYLNRHNGEINVYT